jgi:hypothetical protein
MADQHRTAPNGTDRAEPSIHSMRRPDIAREMTSCWICSV